MLVRARHFWRGLELQSAACPNNITWLLYALCPWVLRIMHVCARSLEVLLTLGAHAQRGLQYLVCLSVRYHFFATTRNEVAKKRYKRVQRYTGLIFKIAIFQKRLRSGDMA